MKIKLAATLFLSMIVVSVLGQPIPKGPYVAQPNGNRDNISVYWVGNLTWPKLCRLEIEFGETGLVNKMTYAGGSADMGTSFEYNFPTQNLNTAFSDLGAWKKFASKIHEEFVCVANDVYLEKTPWIFMGRSVSLDHGETPEGLQALIFKRADRWLSVTLANWFGGIPKVGELITIGQTGRSEYFFPAELVKGQWKMPEAMEKQLAKNNADRK